ncbi:MAG TPA: hypothetical protein VMV58_04765 [Desulfosporosinus sp.]|nr:hypothetical protein [Desulfosporosinus sp.]
MFTVNEYKIVFKKRWHGCHKKVNGRYDTVCEIYVKDLEVPRFTGIAKLHPNDHVDRILGKKIAMRNAIGYFELKDSPKHNFRCADFYNKSVRTAIWKAFQAWVAMWPKKSKDVREIITDYLKANGFDGLYAEECGCQISDLFPCDGPCDDCKPGYKVPCDPKTCQAYGDCEWHIGPKQLHTYEEETNKTKGGG